MHAVPAFTQDPATQHAPVPVQVWSGQQGPAEAPHAALPFPLSQIVPVPVDSPEATHEPETQQPPPTQAVPVAQHDSPGSPHVVTVHVADPVSPTVQLPPLEQVVPDATQSFGPGSQQSPPAQVAPAQQVWPVAPQSTQRPAALHARPSPVQLSPAQHG